MSTSLGLFYTLRIWNSIIFTFLCVISLEFLGFFAFFSYSIIEYEQFLYRSIWTILGTLTDTTTLGQSRPWNIENEGIWSISPELRDMSHISRIGASLSDTVECHTQDTDLREETEILWEKITETKTNIGQLKNLNIKYKSNIIKYNEKNKTRDIPRTSFFWRGILTPLQSVTNRNAVTMRERNILFKFTDKFTKYKIPQNMLPNINLWTDHQVCTNPNEQKYLCPGRSPQLKYISEGVPNILNISFTWIFLQHPVETKTVKLTLFKAKTNDKKSLQINKLKNPPPNWQPLEEPKEIPVNLHIEGACGVMVIVVENEHDDTSSNSERDWLYFT